MPRMGMRVVCTLRLTIDTLLPTSALTSVDLPALGAPITAMKPKRVLSAVSATSPHSLAHQKGRGGRLLCRPLACPFTARGLPALDAHLGGEAGRVIGPRSRNLGVVRQVEALSLGPFLQRRLGVGPFLLRHLELGSPKRAHDVARLLVAGLQENGAEQRLAGVGENGGLVAPAAALFRVAQ